MEIEHLQPPRHLTLQWHVTERCPWRCKHCYQESYTTPEMTLEELFRVRDQFLELLDSMKPAPHHVHINVTGGEPFVRTDILDFLAGLAKYNHRWSWGLLSNGVFLNKENVKYLRTLGIRSFQVSMEGLEERNDEIRGKGAFQKTMHAIILLREAGIRTHVSLTLSRKNAEDVFALAKELAAMGVSGLSARRIVPWGQGKAMQAHILEPAELEDFYRRIEEMNIWFIDNGFAMRVGGGCESGFFYDRVRRHPITGETLMTQNTCAVKEGRILVVMPDGTIFPCRRLPIPVGKLFKDTLKDIYYSPKMSAFRNKNEFAKFAACASRPNLKQCSGGALCVNYGFTGQWDMPDVQCKRAFGDLHAAAEYPRVSEPAVHSN